jgi:hypothetical protein
MPNGNVGTFHPARYEETFEQFKARFSAFPEYGWVEINALYQKHMRDEVFKSEFYQVAIDKHAEHGFGDDAVVWHLSIKRLDKEPIMDWRDLQAIKSQLCGAEAEALQLFPAESRVVDTANQYHLFAMMRAGSTLKPMIPVGWTVGKRLDNNDGRHDVAGAKQRDL